MLQYERCRQIQRMLCSKSQVSGDLICHCAYKVGRSCRRQILKLGVSIILPFLPLRISLLRTFNQPQERQLKAELT